MSLPDFQPQAQLFSWAALSGQLFGADDRFRLFAEKIYPQLVSARDQLAACYCTDNGRPAVEPVLLMGVTLLQFLENVPDRPAVEQLRYHAGWAFALNRPLGEGAFHPTVLVHFRDRLVEHQQAHLAFATILEALQQVGLVARQSQQRLDSMLVIGRLARMNSLECVRETMRLALEELGRTAARFAKPAAWSQWRERYFEHKLDYRNGEETLRAKLQQAGEDLLALQQWVSRLSDSSIAQGENVRLLTRVLAEHFELVEGSGLSPRRAPVPGALQNPHEPDAQWAAKGQGRHRQEVVGYKIQVAETVPDAPRQKGEPTAAFLTAVETQPAIGSDDAGFEQVEAAQAQRGQPPASAWHVDGAYVSAERLARMKAQGRQLIGPAQPAPKKDARYCTEDFDVSVAQRRAVCPAGKPNTQCSRLEEYKTGKVCYRFEWSTHCHDCPSRRNCLGKDQRHRTLVVGEHYDLLQARRREQKTEAFAEQKKKRNAIEGTQSELVRGYGARRARYRGYAKVRLQNYFIGGACNAKRWIRRLQWQMKQDLATGSGAVAVVPSG